MKHLQKKLTLNTLAQFGGKVMGIGLALLTLGLLSRYLGMQRIGEYGTILRYLGFFGIAADLGLNVITAREISKITLRNKAKILANAFTLRLVTATLIMGIALLTAWFLPYSANIKQGLFAGVCAFLLTLWTQIFNGVFQKHLITGKSSLADVFAKLVTLALTFYLITQKASILLLLWALGAGNLVAFLLTLYFIQQLYPLRLRFDFFLWSELLGHAWPVAIANGLILIYFNIDALMLSFMRPMAEVGLYHVAYKILETFFQFIVLFIGLFIPLFAKGLLNRLHFKKYLQTAFNGVLFFTFPLVLGGLLLSSDIIVLINGTSFASAGPILQILFLAMLFLFINHLMHNALTVLDLQKKVLWIYALVAVSNILANFYAIPHFGALGAAYTTLLSEFFIFVLIYFFWKKQRGNYPSLRYGGKLFAISVIMFLALLTVSHFQLWFKLALAASLYFGLFYFFVSEKEVK